MHVFGTHRPIVFPPSWPVWRLMPVSPPPSRPCPPSSCGVTKPSRLASSVPDPSIPRPAVPHAGRRAVDVTTAMEQAKRAADHFMDRDLL
jgi:hypothetical protein